MDRNKIPPWARTEFPEPSPPILKKAIGPVALSRMVFETMIGARRKDIIKACSQLGIRRNTAGAQYQIWKSSKN